MRRESKIILVVCAVLAVILFAVYYPLLSDSQPELTEKDAHKMLDRLADAFARKNVTDVLSFAFEDASVAGRNLKSIHNMLVRAFSQTKDLDVKFADVAYQRQGDVVTLSARVMAGERAKSGGTGEYYSQQVRFTLRRRASPLLGGLIHRYEWRITDVEAPNLPEVDQL